MRRVLLSAIAVIAVVTGKGLLVKAVTSATASQALDKTSPYAVQLDSPVRGLSAQEVDDLLNGRGAGYARTAELNSYPGPRHVLDLKQELDLSLKQVQNIEAIFEQMSGESKQLGREIVTLEQQLSTAFAQRTISEAKIEAQTQQLAMLYGNYRAAHLRPHLEVQRLLSAKQVAEYNRLRGYSNAPLQPVPNANPHHH